MGAGRLRLLQILLSAAILAILIYSLDFSLISKSNFQLDWITAGVVIVLFFVSMWVRSYRWQVLMNHEEGVRINGADSYKLMLVGAALNMVLPAGAGDVARSYFGYKWTGVKERMLSVSLLDKLIAIASLSLLACYSLYYTGEWYFIWAILLSAMPLVGVLALDQLRNIGFINKMFLWLNNRTKKIDIEELARHLKASGGMVVYTLLVSIVGLGLTYAVMFYCFQMVGLDISYWTVLAMAPLITLARLFPFTFNGIGTDEAVIVVLFSTGPDSNSLILVGALIYRILMLFVPALLGLYFLLVLKNMDKSGVSEDS